MTASFCGRCRRPIPDDVPLDYHRGTPVHPGCAPPRDQRDDRRLESSLTVI